MSSLHINQISSLFKSVRNIVHLRMSELQTVAKERLVSWRVVPFSNTSWFVQRCDTAFGSYRQVNTYKLLVRLLIAVPLLKGINPPCRILQLFDMQIECSSLLALKTICILRE